MTALGTAGVISIVIAASAAVLDGTQWYALPLTFAGIALIGVALVLAATKRRSH